MADKSEFDASPSVETRNFHEADRELRANGFEIFARPHGKPAIWKQRRPGKATLYLDQAAALTWVRRRRR